MAQSRLSPPTSFNSAPLVRLLASLDIANAADSSQTFAERLSHWVAWTDAIALSGALGGATAAPASDAKPGGSARASALADQLRRVRKDLTEAIVQDVMFTGAKSDKSVADGTPDESDFDLGTYRRHYLAHQRAMEERIGELRQHARAVASELSPALGRLAMLDAAMDKALVQHQRRVLANVPVMLERRFKNMRKLRQQAASPAAAAVATQAPTRRQRPPAAGQAMQSILLAELETRLQPVEGIIEALGNNLISQT